MRALWLGLAVILAILAGCSGGGGPNVEDCEQSLLGKLKSPASYKQISARSTTLDAHKGTHYQLVEIEYDAANAYGALLRDTERCTYRLDAKGRPTLERFDPHAGISAESIEAAADAALKDADAALANADEAIAEAGEEPIEATASQYPGNCYKDYCPCEPPQEGMDQILCDQLEEGSDVDVQLMIAGRGGREVRRQINEGDY